MRDITAVIRKGLELDDSKEVTNPDTTSNCDENLTLNSSKTIRDPIARNGAILELHNSTIRDDAEQSSCKVLEDYEISNVTGFNMENPLEHLPPDFKIWEEIGSSAYIFAERRTLQELVMQMPLLDHTLMHDYEELRCAHLYLGTIAHCFVYQNGDENPAKSIPPQLAIPFGGISVRLGIPVVCAHYTLIFANWKLINKELPPSFENVEVICKWPGTPNGDWFINTLTMCELLATPAIKVIAESLESQKHLDNEMLIKNINIITDTVLVLKEALKTMMQNLLPDVFYFKQRQFFQGWGQFSKSLPEGLLLEGFSDTPIEAAGGNAAQSPIFHTFDGFLGIKHQKGKKYLDFVLEYMLPPHREFIKRVQNSSRIRQLVIETQDRRLTDAYNSCIQALVDFRSKHVIVVTRYIVIPSKKERGADGSHGTGGTYFMEFLKEIRDTTKAHLLT